MKWSTWSKLVFHSNSISNGFGVTLKGTLIIIWKLPSIHHCQVRFSVNLAAAGKLVLAELLMCIIQASMYNRAGYPMISRCCNTHAYLASIQTLNLTNNPENFERFGFQSTEVVVYWGHLLGKAKQTIFRAIIIIPTPDNSWGEPWCISAGC